MLHEKDKDLENLANRIDRALDRHAKQLMKGMIIAAIIQTMYVENTSPDNLYSKAKTFINHIFRRIWPGDYRETEDPSKTTP